MDEILRPTETETRKPPVVIIGEPVLHKWGTAVTPIADGDRKMSQAAWYWYNNEAKLPPGGAAALTYPLLYAKELTAQSYATEIPVQSRPVREGYAAWMTKLKLQEEIDRLNEEDKFVSKDERDVRTQELKDKISNYDRILVEIYTASDVEVSSASLGKVSALMSEVQAHGDEIGTIYLLPGIAGGLTEMENVVAELTWQGYRVITIGYPESVGTLSEEYAAGGNGKPLGPQTEFMSAILEKITAPVEKGGKPQVLMGFSTGGITAAGILSDKDMAHRFSHAVIMSPGGAQDRSLNAFVKGVASEIGQFITNHTVEFQPGVARRNPDGSEVPIDGKQLILKAETLSRLIPDTMHRQIEMWKALKADDVNTVICASPADLVTGAHSLLREIIGLNPSIKSAEHSGSHLDINANPQEMLVGPFDRIGLPLRDRPADKKHIAPNPFV